MATQYSSVSNMLGITAKAKGAPNTKYDIKTFYTNIGKGMPTLLEYQFLVTLKPENETYDEVDWDSLQLLCQSAQIPQNNIGTAEINYFGKRFTVPTTTQTQNQHEWQTKIIITNDMGAYNQLRNLMLKFSSLDNNMGGQRTIPNIDIEVEVLNQFSETAAKDGTPQPRIILRGAFPTRVDPLQFAYEENAQLMTANVTFTYQYSFFDMAHNKQTTDSLTHGAPVV